MLLGTLCLAAPPVAHATTLLLSSDDALEVEAARDALVATGQFTEPDLPMVVGTASPDLGTLAAHDAVLVWPGAPWDDADALGDVLADYIDGGGAVVLAAPGLIAGSELGGRFASEGYSPVVAGAGASVAGDVDLGASDADHPALVGLSDIAFPDLGQGNPTLAPAGELLAVDSAGNRVLAGLCDRSVFALNLSPPALATSTADAALLLAQTVQATAMDALPTADFGGPLAVLEGGTTSLDAATSEAGDLGPLTHAWDLDGDGAFDDGTGSTATWDATLLDGPSSVTLGLEVVDRCGRAATVTAEGTVDNVAPTFDHVQFAPLGDLGSAVDVSAVASDPVDTVSLSWTWDDGSPADLGAAASHTWSQPGTFTVVVTADDGDGGVATQEGTVLISNPGPTLSLTSVPASLLEGGEGTFVAAATDVLGDPVDLTWSFGDATADASGPDLVEVSHVFADQGTFTLTVTAEDGFGDAAVASAEVVVSNVDPVPTATPATLATEGSGYTAELTAEDPGDDDLTWSLVSGPAGLAVDAAGQVTWTPTFAQGGVGHAVQALVADGDGGSAQQAWSISVSWLDVDGDGLPDTWEASVGLDPTVDDAAGDLDGDGLSNAAEYAAGTQPGTPNVPGVPSPLSPGAGAVVDVATPELRVQAPGDPDGDAVTCAFEIYGDAGLTTLLEASASVVPQQGEAAWTPSADLPEDAESWWRARASDGVGEGPWTVARAVYVDALNADPPLPSVVSPDGGTVEDPVVVLRATAEPDVEGDAIALVFRVFGPALLHTLDAVDLGDAWEAVVPDPLADDVDYTWTAESVDARGGTSGQTDAAGFHLDATNQAPPAPSFEDALEGSRFSEAERPVSVGQGDDADGDPLLVRIEWATDAGFADARPLALDAPDAGGVLAVPDAAWPENADVYWRARSEDDRGGQSGWVVDSGFCDAVDEAPPAPVLIEPLPESTVDPDALVLRWAVVLDPDEHGVTYEARIAADESGPDGDLWSSGAVSAGAGPELEAAPDLDLEPGGYRVWVRATDVTDLSGEWASVRFVVAAPEPGPPADLGPGDGAGWACGHAPGGGAVLALLTVAGRRRRRSVL